MTIYLVRQENSNLYKIGCTRRSVKTRMDELQTANPITLVLVHEYKSKYGYQLEGYLHRMYTDKNVQLEWFELDTTDVDSFLTRCHQAETNFDIIQENTYVQDNASRARKRNSH
jgi:hypothetical protein